LKFNDKRVQRLDKNQKKEYNKENKKWVKVSL